ncbi:MAG: cysteine peptidase family C39 domain-containing protein [Lachnospiraceae bacterium]|nr:cysteine peptidase family C39 domain-containing protein [Lachnospiraceae bacterium]
MFDVTPVTSPKEYDCGATCLKMLLDYYGKSVDLETVISECNIGLMGCTVGDLRRVGNAHGLDIHIFDDRSNPALVDNTLRYDRPAIVWWKYSHFCVYCGLDEKGDAVICNPDRGRFSISVGSFKSMYSGVNLTNGWPGELQEEDPDEVTLTKSEYEEIMEIISKNEEAFVNEQSEAQAADT